MRYAIVPTREVAASGRPVTMDSALEAMLVAMDTMLLDGAAPTMDTMSEGVAPTMNPNPGGSISRQEDTVDDSRQLRHLLLSRAFGTIRYNVLLQ